MIGSRKIAGVLQVILENAIESLPAAVAIYNNNSEMIYSSKSARELFSQLTGDVQKIVNNKRIHKVLKGETISDFELAVAAKDGRKLNLLINCVPIFDKESKISGATAYFLDISEYKNKEKDEERLEGILKALSRSSQAMMRASNEKEYLNDVCRIIVEDCGQPMVWIGFPMDDEGKSVVPAAFAGIDEGYLEHANITWADNERGRGPTGTAIRTGKISWCTDMNVDDNFKPWRKEAIKRGYASSIAFPIMNGDRSFGALTIYSGAAGSFTDDEKNLFKQLAADLSFGIISLRLKTTHAEIEKKLLFQASLIDKINDAIIFMDNDLNITLWNRAAEQMYGWKAEEVIGKRLTDVVQTNLIGEKRNLIVGNTIESRYVSGEVIHHKRDGNAIFVEFNISVVRDSDQNILGYLTLNRDISEKKKAEEKLEYLASFPSLNPNPIFEIDLEGNILYKNAAANRLSIVKIPGVDRSLIETVVTNNIIRREAEIKGQWYRQILHSIAEMSKIRIYMVEITDRINAEIELEKAKSAAENANKAKSLFIANMSHELRTPLNAIMGYSRKLSQSGNYEESQEEAVNIIIRSGEHLLRMINNLLDFSKIEAGKIVLQRQTFNLPELLFSIIDMVKIQAREKPLDFVTRIDHELQELVYGDEGCLEEVLLNLMNNAVKFTEKGSITLCAEKKGQATLFKVEDTGIGIPSDKIDAIFEPFGVLLDSAKKSRGTGLGLSISRNLVRMMGGNLEVQSKTGKGSIFSFELVFENAEKSINEEKIRRRTDIMEKAGKNEIATAGIVPPPRAELEKLAEFARQGDIISIRRWLENDKNSSDRRYDAFSKEVNKLTKNIKIAEIKIFLERLIREVNDEHG